jgi:hypothetical protein
LLEEHIRVQEGSRSQFIHSKFGCTFDNENLRVADFVTITSCKVTWI